MRNTTPDFNSVTRNTADRALTQLKKVDMLPSIAEYITDHLVAVYTSQGDFTVALLMDKRNKQVYTLGVSKRNPDDRFNPLRGKCLALSRAVKAYVVQYVSTGAKFEPMMDHVEIKTIDLKYKYDTV